MNAQEFNNTINFFINHALKEGVAKGKMSTLDCAGILSNHVTGLLKLLHQAQIQAAQSAQAQDDAKSTEIIIPGGLGREIKPPKA